MGAPRAAVPRRCSPASPLLCSPHHLPAAAPSFYSPTSSLQPRRYPSAMSSLCSQGITLQPRRSISTPDRFSHNKPAFPNDPSALSGRSSPGGRPTCTANRLSAAARPVILPESAGPTTLALFRHSILSSSDFAARDWLPRTLAFTLSPNTPPSPLITTHTLTCTHDSPLRNKPPLPCSAPSPSPPGPDRTQKNARTTQGAGVGITE